ncbi:hypothetical protein BC835DRAFT_1103150 [Cytidiella melzeri]|nr:hypothetical protein BC835DRAFT_1103150 [Cytidiella melzeri]
MGMTRSLPHVYSLVLLFGWALAKLCHVKKYADNFRSLYPTTTIVIVENQASWFYESQATRVNPHDEANLQPVADVLDELVRAEGAKFRGVLLHVISNGGALQLMTLSKRLAHTNRKFDSPFPLALVLDSAPDNRSMQAFVTAIVATIQNPALKLLAKPFFTLVYCAFHVNYGYRDGFLAELGKHLNSHNLIPFRRSDQTDAAERSKDAAAWQWLVSRVYMCSDTDEITPLESVLAHGEDAKRLGYDVRMEVFRNSQHVSHARAEPERYWTAVQRLWDDTRSVNVCAKL